MVGVDDLAGLRVGVTDCLSVDGPLEVAVPRAQQHPGPADRLQRVPRHHHFAGRIGTELQMHTRNWWGVHRIADPASGSVGDTTSCFDWFRGGGGAGAGYGGADQSYTGGTSRGQKAAPIHSQTPPRASDDLDVSVHAHSVSGRSDMQVTPS